MIQRNRCMHLTLFYGYFRKKNPVHCRRSLLTSKLSTSTAISATSATALSGWRKSDNNDHYQAILLVWKCYFTVMFLLSLQHRVMHTKCLFHNQFSAIRYCQYEKCKTREKDEFFFIFFPLWVSEHVVLLFFQSFHLFMRSISVIQFRYSSIEQMCSF